MLKELNRYENLGTPNFFWELLRRLEDNRGRWTARNIEEYFFNRIVDGRAVFDGCVPFALAVGIINIDEVGITSVDSDFVQFLLSERYLRGKLLERLFSILQTDATFLEIFSPKNISYDIIYHLIQIDRSAFGFRYANFRQLLIDFDFLNRHPDSNVPKYIVNPKCRTLFDKFILPEVKRRKIGMADLERMTEQRQIQGAKAEDFVLAFERRRLSIHPKVQSIQKISDYDVAAGYDVVSYETPSSDEYDRFIEVKSCSFNRRFYWSKNEVLQARIKRHHYFLYLVNPEKLGQSGYAPLMIQNPFENVFSSDSWEKEAQSWLFQPKGESDR